MDHMSGRLKPLMGRTFKVSLSEAVDIPLPSTASCLDDLLWEGWLRYVWEFHSQRASGVVVSSVVLSCLFVTRISVDPAVQVLSRGVHICLHNQQHPVGNIFTLRCNEYNPTEPNTWRFNDRVWPPPFPLFFACCFVFPTPARLLWAGAEVDGCSEPCKEGRCGSALTHTMLVCCIESGECVSGANRKR